MPIDEKKRLYRDLLDFIYENKPKVFGDGPSRERLKEEFSLSFSRLDGLVNQLKKMDYVEVSASILGDNYSVDITNDGKKYLQKLNELLPEKSEFKDNESTGKTVYNIGQATIGNFRDSSITNIQQNVSIFSQARIKIQKSKLSIPTKKQATKYIATIERESKKKEPNIDIIQRSWKWLDKHAPIVVPVLSEILAEIIKKSMGM